MNPPKLSPGVNENAFVSLQSRLALFWTHLRGERDTSSEMNENFGYLVKHAHTYTEEGPSWGPACRHSCYTVFSYG